MKTDYTGNEFYNALIEGEEILGLKFICTHQGNYTSYTENGQQTKRKYKDRWIATITNADTQADFKLLADFDVYVPDDDYMCNGPMAYPTRHPESVFIRTTLTIRSYKHGVEEVLRGRGGFSCYHIVLWGVDNISRDDATNTLLIESSMTQVIDKEPVEVDVLVKLSLVDGRITIDRLASTEKELQVH